MRITRLTYTALFIALGIVLPRLFHLVGGPGLGAIFLPMHIPVLIGGFFLGPLSGLAIGIMSVGVGFATGMPALPMAAFMLVELSVYGLVAGYIGYTLKQNVYLALIIAMLAGRIASFGLMHFAIGILGIALPPVFGTIGLFATGLPGIIVQLVIIPPLVLLLRRYVRYDKTNAAHVNS